MYLPTGYDFLWRVKALKSPIKIERSDAKPLLSIMQTNLTSLKSPFYAVFRSIKQFNRAEFMHFCQ